MPATQKITKVNVQRAAGFATHGSGEPGVASYRLSLLLEVASFAIVCFLVWAPFSVCASSCSFFLQTDFLLHAHRVPNNSCKKTTNNLESYHMWGSPVE